MAYSGNALAEELTAEQKKAKLNALIAEAAKQAGIELEDEEITIVIKKKSKPEKSDLNTITDEETSGPIIITDDNDDQQTAQASEKTDSQEVVNHNEVAETQPSITPAIDSPDEAVATDAITPAIADTTKQENSQALPTQPKEALDKKVVVNPAIDTTSTPEKEVAIELDNSKPLNEEKPAQVTSTTAEQETATTSDIVDLGETKKPSPSTDELIPDETLTTSTIKEEMVDSNEEKLQEGIIATQETADNTAKTQELALPVNAPVSETAKSTEDIVDTQIQDVQAPKTELPANVEPTPEYFGDYISPEQKMNAYYSADLLEAIESAKTQSNDTAPTDLSEFGLSAMEQGEMSDLVVEGALDATAAGDVSTTSLKTAVVVPDDSILDDANQNSADELLDDRVETSKEDLNKRIKEALAKIGQTSDRGNASGNTNMGALTATNVNVTANINSRITSNATSSFRSSNLNNSNF